MARLSGLQKEVLNLYRQCLRETRKKPDVIIHPFLNPTARSLEPLERRDKGGNYLHWDSRSVGNTLRPSQGPSSTRICPLRSVISLPLSFC